MKKPLLALSLFTSTLTLAQTVQVAAPEPTLEAPKWSLGAGVTFQLPVLGGIGLAYPGAAFGAMAPSVSFERALGPQGALMVGLSGWHSDASVRVGDPSNAQRLTTASTLAGSAGYRHWLVRSDQAPVGVSLWAVGFVRYYTATQQGTDTVMVTYPTLGNTFSGGVQVGFSAERFLTRQLAVRVGTSLVEGMGWFGKNGTYVLDSASNVYVPNEAQSAGFNVSLELRPSVELRLYF